MNAPIPTLDTWPEQTIRGHSIPGSRYTSRGFMKQEWEGMWTRVWLLMGRESELRNPGDWQMEPVGREEIHDLGVDRCRAGPSASPVSQLLDPLLVGVVEGDGLLDGVGV